MVNALITKLYSFGSNGSYQLGLEHNNDISSPALCIIRHDTTQSVAERPSIAKIVGGGNHTFIQLSNNSLKAAGENRDSRCGYLSPQIFEENRDFLIGFQDCLEDVLLCAASWEASAIVCRIETGYAILTTGIGRRGELCQGPGIVNSNGWAAISSPGDFPDAYPIDLCGGMNHFVIVFSNGEVYGWGKGRNGQLGELREDSWKPRKITIPFKAVRAVCGREFTYILGEPASGDHLVIGSDKKGLVSAAPFSFANWMDVGATWSSIFVLDQDGKLHTWGNSTRTTPPKELPKLEQIAVGSEHVLAKTSDGRVIAWGWGKHGNCGLPTDSKFGDVSGRYNEISLDGTVKALGAGCATSWISLED